ncbi:unnamed protein product, partial [Mesorhabditis spiculigera]
MFFTFFREKVRLQRAPEEPAREERVRKFVPSREEEQKKCVPKKVDLEILLDVSTSREDVFEGQRQLAMALVEKLPIESGHIAIGITSFTREAKLLRRLQTTTDRREILDLLRHLEYRGGSTLTARAIGAALQDLHQNRRKDAEGIIVLMNDGFSQDPWSHVLKAAKAIENANVKRFGVALGAEADLRELSLYIGAPERLYRDATRNRFLEDMLKEIGQGCPNEEPEKPTPRPNPCEPEQLDVAFVFDNSVNSTISSERTVNGNKFLLLDILGSLVGITGIRASLISTATPSVVADFSEILERNRLFVAARNIPAVQNVADYHKAVTFALKELRKNARKSSRKALIVVGPGSLTEGPITVEIPSEITRYAVDSSDKTSIRSLEMLTGARKHVFEFDRNADFEKALLKLALPISRMCKDLLMKNFEPTVHLSKKAIPDAEETTKKTTTPGSTTRVPKVFRNLAARITRSTEKPTTTAKTTTTKLRSSSTSRSSTSSSTVALDEQKIENSTHFVSGCLLDVLVVLDASGSVVETFMREKQLVADILNTLRIGPNNARVAVVKFAAEGKVRRVWGFDDVQQKSAILRALHSTPFSSGTTAAHSALQRAISEYSSARGARPGRATPIAIVFTDGFAQKSIESEAAQLRRLIPNTFAVAINQNQRINRDVLETIAGSRSRVFTDEDIQRFLDTLAAHANDCRP